MAKVALALYHRVLPAHAGVDKPIDTLADPQSAAYLLKEPRPWLAHPQHPRRGGASAFGFGGTNFHVVLEERSEEHTSELQSLMRISYAVFCLKKKKKSLFTLTFLITHVQL